MINSERPNAATSWQFQGLGLLCRLCLAFSSAAGLALIVGISPVKPSAAASAGVPRFEPAPCPDFPVPELARARCGYLVVLENRARPTGRTIRLIVAILPAASSRPKADPVVHSASGPGGIGLGEIPFLIGSGLNRDHDLIVMDQRGTLLSKPALTCESADAFDRRLIRAQILLGIDEARPPGRHPRLPPRGPRQGRRSERLQL